MLGGADQEGREADSIRIYLNGLIQDSIEWNLFAKVIDGIAIVAQDGVDQVFADIMHIAKDCRQDNLAFRIAFLFLQVAFQVGDSAFHHLGGLQHKR